VKVEAALVFVLASLLAISLVGDQPVLGLAIAIAGGVAVGVLLVVDDMRRRQK
jgi:hypothetical protein